jgi:hypothetical protein
LLQSLSADDVKFSVGSLLSGMLVGPDIDPTNVLCAADIADQQLQMPTHAIALYDATLQHMDENPESIAGDTDCAAANLNLIDLLRKQRDRDAWLNVVRRAARMPIKRPEQKIQIAYWLHEAREPVLAYKLYVEAMVEVGAPMVATAVGVNVSDLVQMGEMLRLDTESAG